MIYCPECGAVAVTVNTVETAEGNERRRICSQCGYAFATLERFLRELDAERLQHETPGCCASCSHYRPEMPESNCVIFRNNKGIKGGMCGARSIKQMKKEEQKHGEQRPN